MEKLIKYSTDEASQAHLFKILRSQLYSNKIATILREYSVNAMDAHIESGKKDLPISVSLPSHEDPILRIRDYGKGLSFEDIANYYASYGSSSKRNQEGSEEKSTGFLGIGCKSAFSYTDKFGIISYHEGVKSTYAAFLDASGLGKIALVESEPMGSGDLSGMEIAIPVSNLNENQWFKEATEIFFPFKIRPKVVGHRIAPTLYSTIQEIEQTKKSYGMIDSYKSHSLVLNISSVYVNMGGILYPLRRDKVVGLNEICNSFFNCIRRSQRIFILNASIGDISYTASREEIEYNSATISFITKAFSSFLDAVEEEGNSILTSQDTAVQKCLNLEDFMKFDVSFDISRFIKFPEYISNIIKILTNSAYYVKGMSQSLQNIHATLFANYDVEIYNYNTRTASYKMNPHRHAAYLHSLKNCGFVIDASGSTLYKALFKNELKQHFSTVIVFRAKNHPLTSKENKKTSVILPKFNTLKSLNFIDFDSPLALTLTDSMKIDKAVRTKKQYDLADKVRVYNTNGWVSSLTNSFNTKTLQELEDSNIQKYVTIPISPAGRFAGEAMTNWHKKIGIEKPSELVPLLEMCRPYLASNTVICFTTDVEEKFHDNCIDFQDWIKEISLSNLSLRSSLISSFINLHIVDYIKSLYHFFEEEVPNSLKSTVEYSNVRYDRSYKVKEISLKLLSKEELEKEFSKEVALLSLFSPDLRSYVEDVFQPIVALRRTIKFSNTSGPLRKVLTLVKNEFMAFHQAAIDLGNVKTKDKK